MGDYLAIIIPVLNFEERFAMLFGIQQAAPAEVFQSVCLLAKMHCKANNGVSKRLAKFLGCYYRHYQLQLTMAQKDK